MSEAHSVHPAPIRPGSSLYYALQSVPTSRRAALRAWAAWWHEVSSIPMTVGDPGVAQTKLAWWQQEVRHAFEGHPQHPLTQQLFQNPAWHASLPPEAVWQSQLDGLQTLVQQTRWLDEVNLAKHGLATTGAACRGAAHLLGATSAQAMAAADELGLGLRQAHQLARVGQDARLGWLHVPVSVLQQHDVKAHELLRPVMGQAPPQWPALLAQLHGQAGHTLQAAIRKINQLGTAERKVLRPLKTLAALQLALIDEVAAGGSGVLHERIILTPLRKWWIAARARWLG